MKWTKAYNLHQHDIWSAWHSDSRRSILSVKDDLIHMVGTVARAKQLLMNSAPHQKFSVCKAYELFRITWLVKRSVPQVWQAVNVPKQSVIVVLAVKKRMTIVDNLCFTGFGWVNQMRNRMIICTFIVRTLGMFGMLFCNGQVLLELLGWSLRIR